VSHDLLGGARGLPQPVRFLLAGGTAAGVNWLVRFPLSVVMPFLAAVVLAAAIGMLVGFLTYRAFVFPGSLRPLHLQLRDFIAVNLSTLVVVAIAAMAIRGLLAPFMALPLAEAVAHAAAIAIGAVLNYLAHGSLTFAGRSRPARDGGAL
jgi:putative flippase GtrA